MKLSLQQIDAVVCGAEHTYENDGAIGFSRFTDSEAAFYLKRSNDFALKSTSSAGIKLQFRTDSENMYICARQHLSIPSRKYFSYDCFVNGKLIDDIKNYDESLLPEFYAGANYEYAESIEKTFFLGSGDKEVALYLPWNYAVEIKELALDDGATVTPVKNRQFLLFGDSITQGYDALHTSNRYGSRLSRLLGFDEINKAIGGEVFVPELAKFKTNLKPEFIISAYGTNNFAGSFGVKTAAALCREFYENLSFTYPDKQIFAVSPIWRADLMKLWKLNDFSPLEQAMAEAVSDYKNIRFIRGYDFIPHSPSFFGDSTLHPNDAGFDLYAAALFNELQAAR